MKKLLFFAITILNVNLFCSQHSSAQDSQQQAISVLANMANTTSEFQETSSNVEQQIKLVLAHLKEIDTKNEEQIKRIEAELTDLKKRLEQKQSWWKEILQDPTLQRICAMGTFTLLIVCAFADTGTSKRRK